MACTHLEHLPQHITPQVDELVCQDCVAQGRHDWVHLRMCLDCGHVGCCDSSPRKHATGHYKETKHPIMQSFMPQETWCWCYVDEETVDPGKKLY